MPPPVAGHTMFQLIGAVGLGSARRIPANSAKSLGDARFGADAEIGPHSPLIFGDDLFLIGFDGRIDDFRDTGRGHERPDATSTLLAGWRERGTKTLQDLIGDFALAVYDRRDRSLCLAVDAAAQRSLHFRLEPGGVRFASRPAQLALAEDAVDLPSLAELAAFRSSAGPATFFSGVERIQAGEIVRFRDGKILSRARYWQPRLVPDERLTLGAAIEDYRHLLSTAIADRIRGTEIVATHLSSGYDSSAVTATAALTAGADRIRAFTAAPLALPTDRINRHRFADESPLAALAAMQLGIRHEIIRDIGPLAPGWREATRILQSPCALPINQSWLGQIRRRAAGEGAGVLLAAYLGNESLNSGGVETLAEYIACGEVIQWARQSVALQTHDAVSWRGILFNSFGGLLPPRLWNLASAFAPGRTSPGHGFVRREWRDKLPQRRPREPFSPVRARLEALRGAAGGMGRMASIEQSGIAELDPMADRRLLEWSLRLPPRLLLDRGQIRPVARAALADRLPAELLDNPLRGLQAADWPLHLTQAVAREIFEDVSACHAAREILDLEAIDKAIVAFPTELSEALRQSARYQFELTFALSAGLFALQFDRR